MKGRGLYKAIRESVNASELAGEPDPKGWRSWVRSLLANRDNLLENLRFSQERLNDCIAAMEHAMELGYVGDGSTKKMFEDVIAAAGRARKDSQPKGSGQ